MGTYGSAGYVLAAWNGTAANNDLISLPAGASAALEVGSRAVWATSSSDVRALDTPDNTQRRLGIYHSGSALRVRLSFANGYNGTLHLYAVDWDNLNRRESVSVVSGGNTQTIAITTNFSQGAWLHFPVNVPAGGSLTVTVTKTGGPNAVLSGLFLGGAGPPLPPPPPPPPPYEVAPQGDWVGTYGSAGYVLGGLEWDRRRQRSDQPAGRRQRWRWSSRLARRCGRRPSTRRACARYAGRTPSAGWGSTTAAARSGCGSASPTATTARSISMRSTGTTSTAVSRCPWSAAATPRPSPSPTNFSQGAWLHFPVNVPAGGSLTVTVTKTGGPNAVLSGLFLGGAGPPLPPPPPPPPPYEVAPQGDWVGTYGSAGYVLGGLEWDRRQQRSDQPAGRRQRGAGGRLAGGVGDVRAATCVRSIRRTDTQRRLGIYHSGSALRVRLSFANGYNGTLHLYAVDWDNLNRRESVSVVSGGNTQTIAITTNFSQGAWLHFPVNVPAGGSLTVTVTKTGGPNAVLSGLFLGGAGPPLPPPPPPPPPYEVAPQGDWVGTYGSAGYVLAAWNGTAANNDLISLPAGASAALEVGSRAVWATSSSDVRALDTPDNTQRRLGIYHSGSALRVRLSFANGYNGTLHLYAVDWDNLNRRESVSVVSGGNTQTIAITTNFSQGAWLHFPVNVPAGGSLTVTVTKTGGPNAVLSGLFLELAPERDACGRGVALRACPYSGHAMATERVYLDRGRSASPTSDRPPTVAVSQQRTACPVRLTRRIEAAGPATESPSRH